MEALVAVGLASNVLQLVQFAAKVVSKGKEIYDHGSSLAHCDLEYLTKQLIKLNTGLQASLKNRKSQDNNCTDDDEALEIIAANCTAAAKDLIEKLEELQIHSRSRKLRSIRQALKTVWKKDEIDALAERLRGYERILVQYRLGCLESKMDASYAQNAQQVEVFHATSHKLLDRFTNLEATVQGAQLNDKLGTLHEVLVDVRNSIEQPGTRLGVNHDQSVSASNQEKTQYIDSPTKPVLHTSTPTEGQFQIMFGMIQRLQEQIAMQSGKMDSILINEWRRYSKEAEDSASQKSTNIPAESKELAIHIENLSRFASKKGTVMLSQDADSVIESLDKILEAFAEGEKARVKREQHDRRKRSHSPDADDIVYHTPPSERDIKRTRGMLATVQCFGINKPGSWSKQILCRQRYSSQTDCSSVELGHASLLFIRKRQQLRQLAADEIEAGVADPSGPVVEHYSSALELVPCGAFPKRKITASFVQYTMYHSTTVLKSVLSFASIVPDDAQVWDYIRADDVTNLQRLMEKGLSAISDCDSDGRSLLAHAVRNESPHITKFLIEHGLDVNEVVKDIGDTVLVIDFTNGLDCHCNSSELQNRLDCRRLLLEAAADPMETFEPECSALNQACLCGIFRSLKIMLDLGGELLDINYVDPYSGHSALGQICCGVIGSEELAESPGLRPDLLDLLLARGANPLVPQVVQQTCLHVAINTLGQERRHFGCKARENSECNKRICFDCEKSKTFLVRLMAATAKARGLEHSGENLGLENQLGLLTEDDRGQTPLDQARRMCFTRQKVFQDALTQCGVPYSLYSIGGRCPNEFKRDLFGDLCFCQPNTLEHSTENGRLVTQHHSADGNFSYDDDSENCNSEDGDSESYLSLVDYYERGYSEDK